MKRHAKRSKPRTSRTTGRVTLSQVARQAGVSPITASRALRGIATVAADLTDRVRLAADVLGYVPDPAARALASARSSTVAVLIPSLTNIVFIELLEAIHRVLLPLGYQVLIGNSHYSYEEEEYLLRTYLGSRLSGMMVTGFDRSEVTRHLIATSGVPCVHLMELTKTPGVHCVGFLQREAGAAIAHHLLHRGRKRIAFVAAQLDARTLQRGEGFRRVLRDAGLHDSTLERLSPASSSISMGAQILKELLQTRPDIDGIFFCNDDLAQGALLQAIRLGIEVPRRVAIVGFNDLPGSAEMVPRLTTVRTPRSEVGDRAARLLVRLMKGETPPESAIDLGFKLIEREST